MTVLADYVFRMHHDGPGPFGLALFALLLLVVVGALVALAVRLFGYGPRPPAVPTATAPTAPAGDPALETLRLRYARGELTRDEFLRAREDLGAKPGPGEMREPGDTTPVS
jgi:uncharacterized membrane protein